MLKTNTIYHGNCISLMQKIDDKSIDMTLTDIPYDVINRKSNGLRNLDKGNADILNISLEAIVKNLIRVTQGSIYIFCSTEQDSEIREIMVENKLSTRLIIWNKTNPSPMNGKHIWLSSVECCVYGKFPKATFNEHCKGSVLNFPNGKGKIHPTEKPLALFEYLIKASSKEGDLILDPFAGSFTTAIASENLRRNWICIEKESNYCEIGRNRINENRGK